MARDNGGQGQFLLLPTGQGLRRAPAHLVETEPDQSLIHALADLTTGQAEVFEAKDNLLFHRLGQHLGCRILKYQSCSLGQLPEQGLLSS